MMDGEMDRFMIETVCRWQRVHLLKPAVLVEFLTLWVISVNRDYWRLCTVTQVPWEVRWAVVSRPLWWGMTPMAYEPCCSYRLSALQTPSTCP